MSTSKREIPVWGGHIDGRCRLIVKARSKAAARRALEAVSRSCSSQRFRAFFDETGNAVELALATEEGVVFEGRRCAMNSREDFVRLEPGVWTPPAHYKR